MELVDRLAALSGKAKDRQRVAVRRPSALSVRPRNCLWNSGGFDYRDGPQHKERFPTPGRQGLKETGVFPPDFRLCP